jgi:DNA repair exonuclease SbcCD nuclease subunit
MRIAVIGDVHLLEHNPKSRKDNYFHAIMDKIRRISEENDTLLFLGDIFERPTISIGALYQVFGLFLELQRSGKRVYSIIGNHDIPHYNTSDLNRTSLGVLALSGLIEILTDKVDVGGLSVQAIPFDPREFNKKSVGDSILLGHCFFESSDDPDYSITRDQLMDSGYSHCFLGHDHSPYGEEMVGDVKVCRPGSICRNTSHSYNLTRTPEYYQILYGDGVFSVELRRIPCPPPQEVFSNWVFDRPCSNNVLRANVEDILEKYTINRSDASREFTVKKALEILKAGEDHVNTIKTWYQQNNEVFQ